MNNEISNLKEESVPKKEYEDLQFRFDSEIKSLDDQITGLKETTVPKTD